MIVYVIAFALTMLFIYWAKYYYNMYIRAHGVNVATFHGAKARDLYFDALAPILCYDKANEKRYYRNYLIAFSLSVMPLFLLAALRYDVGTDYMYTYFPGFYKIMGGHLEYSEMGFNLLIMFIQVFTDNAQWLFVVTGFLFAFFMINNAIKFTPYASISMVVVFFSCIFFASLNIVRQSISIMIIMAGVPYILNKDFKRYLICVLFGTLFHLSSLIMIIPYFIINFGFIKKHFLWCCIGALVGLPILSKVMELILFNTKYHYYFVSHFNNGNIDVMTLCYNACTFIASYVLLRKAYKQNKFVYLLLVMQYCALWISSLNLFIHIPTMIQRAVMHFSTYQMLLVPQILRFQQGNRNKLIALGAYVVPYFFYFLFNIVLWNMHDVWEYKWIFMPY